MKVFIYKFSLEYVDILVKFSREVRVQMVYFFTGEEKARGYFRWFSWSSSFSGLHLFCLNSNF